MQHSSIKDYLFNKLFFPKVVKIDKPGIIYTISDRKFGNPGARKRIIWHFEDIVVNLILETVKELGKKKTQELWYKIGKDVGTRYLLLAKIKPLPLFILNHVIVYIFQSLKAGGFSLAEDIKYNSKKRSLVLRGNNNIICRKTKICTAEGIISALFSFLNKENIEAEAKCENCPNGCLVVANKNIKEKLCSIFSILNFLLKI